MESALAEHVLAARKVVNPRTALFPPSERALEIQPELPEAHAWEAVIGLVGVAVKNNLVQAIGKLFVAIGLEAEGMLRPAIILAERSESLAGDNFLPIGMGRAGGFLGVVLAAFGIRRIAGVEFAAEPEFALRDVHLPEALELIDRNRHADAGCLALEEDAMFVQDFAERAVEIFVDQVGHGASVVPQEAIRLIHTIDDAARQSGKPFGDVVASPRVKFGGEFRSPGLATSLPAINIHILENRSEERPKSLADLAEHAVIEVVLQGFGAEFIDLKSGRSLGHWLDLVAVRRVAEAQDRPATFGQGGLQNAAWNHVGGEVEDLIRRDDVFVSWFLRGEVRSGLVRALAGCFFVNAGQACGLKIEFRQLDSVGRGFDIEAHEACRRFRETINQLDLSGMHRGLPES